MAGLLFWERKNVMRLDLKKSRDLLKKNFFFKFSLVNIVITAIVGKYLYF